MCAGRCRSRNRDGVKPGNSRRSPTCVRNRDTSPDALATRRSRSLCYADIGSCEVPIHFAALDLLKACRDPWSARNDSSASWPEGDHNLRDGSQSSTPETPRAIRGQRPQMGAPSPFGGLAWSVKNATLGGHEARNDDTSPTDLSDGHSPQIRRLSWPRLR